MNASEFFSAHKKIGFQFSGGRDSLAALHVLREFWEEMTVYHLDAGDQFPETKEVVSKVEELVPYFERIAGELDKTETAYGWATDLLPTQNNSILGKMHSGSRVGLLDRYECCYLSVMKPMHERMRKDGITLIIRGQRNADYAKRPLTSGDWNDGMQAFYPIADWTDAQVMEYLRSINVKPAAFYDAGLKTTPECMTCTAWWDDHRGGYLAKHHPEQHEKYRRKLLLVSAEIAVQLQHLHRELGVTHA